MINVEINDYLYVVDDMTGEVLDRQYIGEPPKEPIYLTEFIYKDQFEKHFKDELAHKVLWMNWSLSSLLSLDISKKDSQRFVQLCDLIIARNILFEHTSVFAGVWSIREDNVARTLNKFIENGLLRIVKRDVHKRGQHLMMVNPTWVWKGYIHQAQDYEDEVSYGPNYCFSRLHRRAINEWRRSSSQPDGRNIDR